MSQVLTDLKSTTSRTRAHVTEVPNRTVAPAGTPSGGWKEFAVRRTG